ncbi:MAG: polysaccharide biosynthesis/export family protein [Pirellulales bacterium]|nr:polysaccharide biosynthesis/export family protein [Pirellulales bacterium]
MNEISSFFLFELGRTTLFLIAVATAAALILRLARPASPRVHRLAWCLVLLVGWLFVRMPVAIPWYETPADMPGATAGLSSSESEEPVAIDDTNIEPLAPVDAQAAVDPSRPVEIDPGYSAGAGTLVEITETPTETEELPLGEPPTPPTAELADTALTPVPVVAAELPAKASPPAQGGFSWTLGLLLAWIAGMAVCLLRWLAGYVRSIRGMSTALVPDDDSLHQWQVLLAEHKIDRKIPLRLTPGMGPLLCRWPDGYELVVPSELWSSLSPRARLSIMRHELAHYERGDVWKSLAMRVLALPHWFNPASWWAVRRFEEAAEWACDQAAVAAGQQPQTEYARILVSMAESSLGGGSCHPAMSRWNLSARVRRLLSSSNVKDSIMKKTLLLAMALTLVTVCLVRVDLVAKPPAAEKPSRTTADLAVDDSADIATDEPVDLMESEPSLSESGSVDAGDVIKISDDEPGVTVEQKYGNVDLNGDAPVRTRLRYDGRSFDQWKQRVPEIKLAETIEAVRAFAAFGSRGYGPEATEQILLLIRKHGPEPPKTTPGRAMGDRMGEMPMGMMGGGMEMGGGMGLGGGVGREDHDKALADSLDSIARYTLVVEHGKTTVNVIPREDSLPVLCRELDEGNAKSKSFTLSVLRENGRHSAPTTTALAHFIRDDENRDQHARAFAILVLADPTGDTTAGILRESIERDKSFPSALVTSLLNDRSTTWIHLKGNLRWTLAPGFRGVLDVLVECLDRDEPAIRGPATFHLSHALGTTLNTLANTWPVSSKELVRNVSLEELRVPMERFIRVYAQADLKQRPQLASLASVGLAQSLLQEAANNVDNQLAAAAKEMLRDVGAQEADGLAPGMGEMGMGIGGPAGPGIKPKEKSRRPRSLRRAPLPAKTEKSEPSPATAKSEPAPSTVLPGLPPDAPPAPRPHEGAMVSLPSYRIEPPDVLQIEVMKLVPIPPYRAKIYDVLQINVLNTLIDQPINNYYLVEADGFVTLGPAYGKVKLLNLTTDEAEKAVRTKLLEVLHSPEVSVQLARTSGLQPVTGPYLVGPDGTINLRAYGSVHVAGKTITEAKEQIERHLSKWLKSPEVSVDVASYNSKVYYIIVSLKDGGQSIHRVPITGNETVLDAIAQIRGLRILPVTTVHVSRPKPGGQGKDTMLPVDFKSITRGKTTATNYQLLPGDRVFISGADLVDTKEPLISLRSRGGKSASTAGSNTDVRMQLLHQQLQIHLEQQTRISSELRALKAESQAAAAALRRLDESTPIHGVELEDMMRKDSVCRDLQKKLADLEQVLLQAAAKAQPGKNNRFAAQIRDQVKTLQKQLDARKKKLSNLLAEARRKDLEEKMADLDARTGVLKDEAKSLQTTIESLRAEFKKLGPPSDGSQTHRSDSTITIAPSTCLNLPIAPTEFPSLSTGSRGSGTLTLSGNATPWPSAPQPSTQPPPPPSENFLLGDPGGESRIYGQASIEVRGPTKSAKELARENLRYHGKSFGEWKESLETEVSPDRRFEAIQALTAFGARGYGKEAAEVIATLMRQHGGDVLDGTARTRLLAAGIAAFTDTEQAGKVGFPDAIPPEDGVPVLCRELSEGNRKSRGFALYALNGLGVKASAAAPALAEYIKSKASAEKGSRGTEYREWAFRNLVALDPSGEATTDVLRATIAKPGSKYPQSLIDMAIDKSPHETVPDRKGDLQPGERGVVEFVAECLENDRAEIRQAALSDLACFLASLDRPADPIWFRRGGSSEPFRFSQETLDFAQKMMNRLVAAYAKADEKTRFAVIRTLMKYNRRNSHIRDLAQRALRDAEAAVKAGKGSPDVEAAARELYSALGEKAPRSSAKKAPAPPKPKLGVRITGPSSIPSEQVQQRYVDVTIQIANMGNTRLTGITVAYDGNAQTPPVMASADYRVEGNNLIWTIDSLNVGKKVKFAIRCKPSSKPGTMRHAVRVTSAEGAEAAHEYLLEIPEPEKQLVPVDVSGKVSTATPLRSQQPGRKSAAQNTSPNARLADGLIPTVESFVDKLTHGKNDEAVALLGQDVQKSNRYALPKLLRELDFSKALITSYAIGGNGSAQAVLEPATLKATGEQMSLLLILRRDAAAENGWKIHGASLGKHKAKPKAKPLPAAPDPFGESPKAETKASPDKAAKTSKQGSLHLVYEVIREGQGGRTRGATTGRGGVGERLDG